MERIIDFRLRPPIGGILKFRFYAGGRISFYAEKHRFQPSRAATERSMDLFWKEVSAAKVTHGVMNARQVGDTYGGPTSDEIAAIQEMFPDKLTGFGTTQLGHPKGRSAMLAEVDRVINELGLKGISLDPGWSDPPVHADHEDVKAVAARCAELGVPLMLTASGLLGPDTAFSHPVYIDRLAAACPKTTIIAAHGGWPLVQEMCAVALARPNVYVSADQGMLNTVGTMDYVAAINTFMGDQFLFASSYPTGPLQGSIDTLAKLPINDAMRPKIMYENAARVLGLR